MLFNISYKMEREVVERTEDPFLHKTIEDPSIVKTLGEMEAWLKANAPDEKAITDLLMNYYETGDEGSTFLPDDLFTFWDSWHDWMADEEEPFEEWLSNWKDKRE